MTTRKLFLGFLVATFLIAAVVSGFASTDPDGLEHVAETVGFGDTATDHAAGDGPLADYSVKGVDDDRLSGGLAGVIGVVVTLLLAGGLTFALRRRGEPSER